ncbi:hypothetical protein A7985_25100 [Pseudoalteromonas luteoviolacea]|uniref:Peptidase M23 domain-containing protein n=1 Tax=Pseudoalteromonas luteoviolacea TaxID=43657 RepID=A0A1C0TIJ9_9GAMM|nr:M23/M56 family metallopeptidase [Pseudoalteromonas luteoviolacea]MBQ4814537.1 peptidoglycan DD-metalloendopeptidase family protein [Pseudoalteromonas luteoviolacea]OCQ17929.1 hypothetical protein A7985_25100 [Pseudoalteromonas luteoviolacea]
MVWSTLIGPIVAALFWSVVSGILFYCAKRMSYKHPASTRLWWSVLILSALPIMPLGIDSTTGSVPKILLEMGGYIEQKQIKLSEAYASSMIIEAQDILMLMFAMVFGVSLLRLARLTINWYKLKKHLSSLKPLSLDWTDTPCVEIPSNISPFVFGVIKPTLIIPHYFWRLDKAQQQALIYHELVHIRNKDHIALVIWRVLSCLFWFNPYIRKMEQAFVGAMECRCDQGTVTTFQLNKKDYAATLLAILKRSVESKNVTGVAHFSSEALTLDDYKVRLRHIVKPQPKQPLLLAFSLLLVSVCLAVLNIKAAPFVRNMDAGWHNPMRDFNISSFYGHVSQFRNMKPHGGIDLVAPIGSRIMAIADGKVLIADDKSLPHRYGKVVLLQHKNGYQSLYAHLDSINVESGQMVTGGQSIGTLGETGKVTGPHLHLELIHREQRINPLAVLDLK